MGREIKLNGGEISILKAIGTSGAPISGKRLIERTADMATAEVLDALGGLLSMGYVLANRVNIRLIADMQQALLRVNPSYARDLKESMNPTKSRDEQRGRRQRRG